MVDLCYCVINCLVPALNCEVDTCLDLGLCSPTFTLHSKKSLIPHLVTVLDISLFYREGLLLWFHLQSVRVRLLFVYTLWSQMLLL